MKFKVTRKEMKENYNNIISIGYCNAQYLLHFHDPIAYSTRAEGWACDYYEVNGVLISTGYAPINSKHVNKISYDQLKNFDDIAQELIYCNDLNHEGKKHKVNELLIKLVGIATK